MKRTDLNELMNKCREIKDCENFGEKIQRLLDDYECHATAKIDDDYLEKYDIIDVVDNHTHEYLFRIETSCNKVHDVFEANDYIFNQNPAKLEDVDTIFTDREIVTIKELCDRMAKNGYLSEQIDTISDDYDSVTHVSDSCNSIDELEKLCSRYEDGFNGYDEYHIITFSLFTVFANFDTRQNYDIVFDVVERNDDLYESKVLIHQIKATD